MLASAAGELVVDVDSVSLELDVDSIDVGDDVVDMAALVGVAEVMGGILRVDDNGTAVGLMRTIEPGSR